LGRDRADQLKQLLKKYVLKRTKRVVLAGQLPRKAGAQISQSASKCKEQS
jgi:hypothetical protein